MTLQQQQNRWDDDDTFEADMEEDEETFGEFLGGVSAILPLFCQC